MPDMKMQSRLALGLNVLAILKAVKEEGFLGEVRQLANDLDIEKLENVGKKLAEKALAKKISRAVFDRGGYKYHGRVKALADGAREGGLKF